MGCLGRRAISNCEDADIVPAIAANLVESLATEENRLSMDKAQRRSIKLVRPTDDCDVCEGIGIDYGQPRFKPVRSAVRENALWSMVILCSHGPTRLQDSLDSTIQCLTEIAERDENVFCVGFAMDALNRLVQIGSDTTKSTQTVSQLKSKLTSVLLTSPILPTESLVRGGAQVEELQKLNP